MHNRRQCDPERSHKSTNTKDQAHNYVHHVVKVSERSKQPSLTRIMFLGTAFSPSFSTACRCTDTVYCGHDVMHAPVPDAIPKHFQSVDTYRKLPNSHPPLIPTSVDGKRGTGYSMV